MVGRSRYREVSFVADRKEALLVAAVALSFAWFHQGAGWNQASRLDLARAIVEDGTLSIDGPCGHVPGSVPATCANTGDFAVRDGRLYSDKAPGVSLVAVPAVAAARPVLRAAGVDPASPRGLSAVLWAATVLAVGLPLAISMLAFLAVSRRLAARGGVFATVVLCLGTPTWAYATHLWGHALAAACLVAAFAAAAAVADGGSRRRRFLLGLATGASGGLAVVTELTAVGPAALVAGFALTSARPRGRRAVVGVAGGLLAGAGAFAALLLAYDAAAFGSPFAIGYASVSGFEGMRRGLFGVGLPRGDVLAEILVGERRGLLVLAPVLAVAPAGLLLALREPGKRALAAVALAVAAWYVLLNASYFYWTGGWSYGPRHLAPAIPFLCLGLAPLWDRLRTPGRVALGTLAAAGAAQALLAVAVYPVPPDTLARPVRDLLLPAFLRGEVAIRTGVAGGVSLGARDGATNVGLLLGLPGRASLLPLAVAWMAVAWVFAGGRRYSSPPSSPSSSGPPGS